MRIFAVIVVMFALATFGCPGRPFAEDQDSAPSAPVKLPDSAHKVSVIANAQADSESKNDDGCDHEATSDDDKAADAKSGDNDSPDAKDAADNAQNGDQKSIAQEKSDDSDLENADGCDQQNAAEQNPGDAPEAQRRPYQETKVDFYRDSQGYRTATVSTDNHFTLGNFSMDLTRDTVFASDSQGSERSEDTMISFFTDLNEQFGIGGGFGSVYSQGWSLPVGSLKTTTNLDQMTIEAGVSHSLLAISAETIRSRVTQTDASASISYEITQDFAPTLEFHHINYSDRNSSIGVDFAPQYTFHFDASQIQIGYDFTYQSFATNPNDGYWAPQRLIANKLTGAWIFDRVDYFGRVEASLGPESAQQINSQPSAPRGGFATSAGASFGIRPSRDMVLQCNFAGDRSPGWNSAQIGFSLKYFF